MTRSSRPAQRKSKKTASLEIRLTPEDKQSFLDACARAGRTASEVLRDAMSEFIAAHGGKSIRQGAFLTMSISLIAALAAWIVFDPSPAQAESQISTQIEIIAEGVSGDPPALQRRRVVTEVMLAEDEAVRFALEENGPVYIGRFTAVGQALPERLTIDVTPGEIISMDRPGRPGERQSGRLYGIAFGAMLDADTPVAKIEPVTLRVPLRGHAERMVDITSEDGRLLQALTIRLHPITQLAAPDCAGAEHMASAPWPVDAAGTALAVPEDGYYVNLRYDVSATGTPANISVMNAGAGTPPAFVTAAIGAIQASCFGPGERTGEMHQVRFEDSPA